MTNVGRSTSSSVIWEGRPWIAPAAAARTVLVVAVGLLFVWLEYFTGTANDPILGVAVVYWTIAAFFVVWLAGIAGLLVQRATNKYTLRVDGLEIRTGVFTSRSFVLVASGFSDLEVIRGVVGRIIEYGDIIIRTQSERNAQEVMVKVRDPLKVAEQIRYVMGRQIVRVEPTTAAQNPP
jgi:uncharacterized membrane protein YdbT with pleckstrin-like domain